MGVGGEGYLPRADLAGLRAVFLRHASIVDKGGQSCLSHEDFVVRWVNGLYSMVTQTTCT
jgi:hypothetical protein